MSDTSDTALSAILLPEEGTGDRARLRSQGRVQVIAILRRPAPSFSNRFVAFAVVVGLVLAIAVTVLLLTTRRSTSPVAFASPAARAVLRSDGEALIGGG